MRFFFDRTTKNIISGLLVTFACAFLVCAYLVEYSPLLDLSFGRATYAFNSRSSNAIFIDESECQVGTHFVGYKAKSVFIGKNSPDYTSARDKIKRLLAEYQAKAVYCERVEGVVDCLYFYSDKIPVYQIIYTDKSEHNPSGIGAVKVNIHIALSENGITVGCPFIYCSF